MNSYDTFLFPDTNIFCEKYYPLLLFCSPLHFLQLAEPGPESDTRSEAALFLESGLRRAHIPAPLGDKREPFLRLICDIKQQREQYVTELNALITDSTRAPTKAETADLKHKIGSILLQKLGVKHEISETELSLWQDRLVLAMAEILGRFEEDLQEQLSLFTKEEIAAFRSLQEVNNTTEDDFVREIMNIKTRQGEPQLGSNIKRFEAWLRLLKNRPVPRVKMWLASTRESADQVFERYHTGGIVGASSVPVLKLALPAHIAASGRYVVQQIEAFQQKTTHIHQGLVADFERIVTTVPYVGDSHQSLLPYKTDWADHWEGMLDEYFPASNTGRIEITFYLLPNRPVARLLSLQESTDGMADQVEHGLLGILGSSKST
jgi:hypothetical protein